MPGPMIMAVLREQVDTLTRLLNEANREIEVLTTERDNALLEAEQNLLAGEAARDRIEYLEQRLDEWEKGL